MVPCAEARTGRLVLTLNWLAGRKYERACNLCRWGGGVPVRGEGDPGRRYARGWVDLGGAQWRRGRESRASGLGLVASQAWIEIPSVWVGMTRKNRGKLPSSLPRLLHDP